MRIRPLVFCLITSVLFFSCTKDVEIPEPNKVPVADAGTVKTITLPATVTLTGTGTDPDGVIKAYLWSQVSGPAASTISNPGNAITTVKFTIDGAYLFQLMVTDSLGATGVDTVTVIVNPAQEITLNLKPANNPFEKMLVSIGGVDNSFTGSQEWVIDAWTKGGQVWIGRNVFKYDLSSIPSAATIVSANLYLYSNTPPLNGNFIDANYGTSNGLILQQINQDWNVATANWNNQPAVKTSNQILIPHTSFSALDINIDVTSMVASMVNTNSNYGFLLRLQNEVPFQARMFVSSHNTAKPDKHPKLVIVYR